MSEKKRNTRMVPAPTCRDCGATDDIKRRWESGHDLRRQHRKPEEWPFLCARCAPEYGVELARAG